MRIAQTIAKEGFSRLYPLLQQKLLFNHNLGEMCLLAQALQVLIMSDERQSSPAPFIKEMNSVSRAGKPVERR